MNKQLRTRAFDYFLTGHSPNAVAGMLAVDLDVVAAWFFEYAESKRMTAKDERFANRLAIRSKLQTALAVLEDATAIPDTLDKEEAAAWNIKVKAAQTLLAFASKHSEDDPVTWFSEKPATRRQRGKFIYHSKMRDDGASTLFAEFVEDTTATDAIKNNPDIVETEMKFDPTDLF